MFLKSFAGTLALAGAVSATYGAVANGVDDACLAIRKTIQTTVTVTVNPDGSWPYTPASGPKVDGKPSGAYVHAAASGKGYGKDEANAGKISSSSSLKKGGYGHGSWDDEPAATSSGSWKHGYGGHGSWDSEDDEVVASKSWGSGGYGKDPKYSHAYAKASTTSCDITEDSYKPSSPAGGYYGKPSSSSVGGKAGYNNKVTSSSVASEAYEHLPSFSGHAEPSNFPHSNAPEPSIIRSSSRTWSFSNSTWTRSSASQSIATSSKLSSLSSSASSSKASSSFISSGSVTSSKASSSSASSSSSVVSSASSTSSSPLSSSSSSTISSSVTSFTSSSSSSTVSSASSTSSCIATIPGNAVLNGGFQLGVLPPWTATTDGNVQLAGTGGVAQDSNSQDGDGFDFVYLVISGSGSVTLTQTVAILDGTTVSCSAYLQSTGNNPLVANLAISIDGAPCGSITQAPAAGSPFTNWQPATGSVVVSGNTHVVTIATSANNVDTAGGIMYIDNIQIIPTAGPGSLPVCITT